MNGKTAKDLLYTDFPLEIRVHIASSISKAYAYVNDLKNTLEIFQFPSAINIIPYFKNIAVEFMLQNDINNGLLPFRYRFKENAGQNHKHIEILTTNFILTISQVSDRFVIPRKAIFRNNLCLKNRKYLPLDFGDNVIQLPNQSGNFYALITHGYQSDMPQFINLGVPDPTNNRWINRINILEEAYDLLEAEKTRTDEEEVKIKLKLKQHLQEVVNNEAE